MYLFYLIHEIHQYLTYFYLDDMSDLSRKNNNLYLKLGFHYLYKYGPEMSCSSRINKKICKKLIVATSLLASMSLSAATQWMLS